MRMKRRPPLRSLTAFEAAARLGNFSDAARELDISTSAISHQIKLLETFLGTRLFARLSRGVRLTSDGEAFHASVHEAYLRIDDGTRRIMRRRGVETLTVRVGLSFGVRWLAPRLPLFLAEYPDIDLRIVTPIVGSASIPADAIITYGVFGMPGHHAELFPEEDVVPMCSPSLLRDGDILKGPGDVTKFRLIESVVAGVSWEQWLSAHGVKLGDHSHVAFDTIVLTLQAAISGIGIALEGDFLASEDLASGRLVVPPALRTLRIRRSLRAFLVPERHARAAKVQIFRDWLFTNLARR